jgi:hypothetical protein
MTQNTPTTKYLVRYYAPGTFTGESWDQEVEQPDPRRIDWPEKAYAFRFYQQRYVELDGEVLTGEKEPVDSTTYYHPECQVIDIEGALNHPLGTKILVENMKTNGYSHLICRKGQRWLHVFNPETGVILKQKEEQDHA